MNTSLSSKDTALLTALQAPLEGDIHARMAGLICLFIIALSEECLNNSDNLAYKFEPNASNKVNFLSFR